MSKQYEHIPAEALKVLRKMFKEMAAAGWNPSSVFDGGEVVPTSTDRAALEVINSVSESHVRFRKEGVEGVRRVFVIQGNGEDVICDHSGSRGEGDDFEAVMERIYG